MRDFQKRINEVEDAFIASEETPEDIQKVYDGLLALVQSDDFAEEVLEHGACMDALWTPTLDEDYSPDDRAEVQWENTFTPEQVKTLEDTANEKIDAYVEESGYYDDPEPVCLFPWNY